MQEVKQIYQGIFMQKAGHQSYFEKKTPLSHSRTEIQLKYLIENVLFSFNGKRE